MSRSRDARRVLPWLVDGGMVLEWSEIPDEGGGGRLRFSVKTADGRFHKYTSREVLAFFAGSCSRGDRDRDMRGVGLPDAQDVL